MREAAHECVDERHDLVPLPDRERAARHEIELHVSRQKDVVVADRDRRRHERLP